ncbi:Halomucin [Frankliniella fusca]|nr:Halomucin [Frankliniella fusca]
MSESGNDNVEVYEDSPPSSPNPLSSPAQRILSEHSSSEIRSNSNSISSAFENLSDNSSQRSAKPSPPSSPVRHGQKRPSYAAYKENPSLPVPRQTVDRWKRMRLESHSEHALDDDKSSDDDHAQDISEPHDFDHQAPADDCQEGSREPCYLTQPNIEISDSGEDDSGEDDSSGKGDNSEDDIDRGSNDSTVPNEVNSDGGFSSNDSSNFSCENIDNDSDLDSNCGDDPFEVNSLYPGCGKTKDEAIHGLINVYLRNKLSKNALKDFLNLYVSSLPTNNVMPRSVYHLLQYVNNLSMPCFNYVIEHFYCRPGMHLVVSKLEPCATCNSENFGVFYELPLEKIIKFLFEHRGLADLIDKYSENRGRDGVIRDVLDGSEYLRVWSDVGVKKYQLTLILNTDGVSPHASSKAKFWPLMFTIMEIPPRLRSSFTLVWGIWFDKKLKPNMNLFLKPFVSSLVKINSEGGVSWKNPTTSLTHTSLVRAPLIVADAPARAGVLNMQEHQSKYACNACEQKTSKLPPPPTLPGERKKIRKRRFTFKEIAATLRTNHRMLACGTLGTDLNPKRGLKGLTVIQDIPFLDLSTCVLAEYMHCALGVVKQICSLWLFERGPWNIADNLEEINRFLEQEIHPPDFVSRLPRSLEYFSQLKCNEFRSFLLYFSLVICAPYLKEEYHQHWILFVHAMFLLLSDSISETDLITAETLIRLFVRDIGPLYGDKNYVYNVHQLLHLALYVRRWGPLWSNSAFGFEDVNGTLAAMIHGSKHEGRELINQLTLAQGNQML